MSSPSENTSTVNMQNTEKGTAKESGSVMGSTLASLSASAVAPILRVPSNVPIDPSPLMASGNTTTDNGFQRNISARRVEYCEHTGT